MKPSREEVLKEAGDMRIADAAMAELKRQIAADHKPGYGIHKTSDKANHRYRNGFLAGYEAGAKSERAVSDRLLDALKDTMETAIALSGSDNSCDPEISYPEYEELITEVEAMRKRPQQVAPKKGEK